MVESTVTITGRVAGDVTFNRYDGNATEASKARAMFRIAFSRSWYDAELGGYVNGPTSFLTVKCWRRLAENVASSLSKGQPVVVTGRITVGSWDREGQKVSEAEIVASSVGHDLNYGTAAFRRGNRSEWASEASPNEADAARAAASPTADPQGVTRGTARAEAPGQDGDSEDAPGPADSTSTGAERQAA